MLTSYLQELEAESIFILREVVATMKKPLLMYSIGKDSSVLLHLAQKAFYPGKIPFPLLHIDTTWKFKEMIKFRDDTIKKLNLDIIIYQNQEGIKKNINPFEHGAFYTDFMKTTALKQALENYKCDVAIGGARRDEEKSRAKERVFSFRGLQQTWDPKNQRPELWHIYNTYVSQGESLRVFPLSNWTELDVWKYIEYEKIPVVPLYFSAERPVIKKNDQWIMIDDDRFPLQSTDQICMKKVRFRTLGCYPLTGAVESHAKDVSGIIAELLLVTTSERQGRMIDQDQSSSMEKKKREGYF